MKIQIPWFVETEDQHVWVLTAFMRRLYLEFNIKNQVGVDMYTRDVKIILDIEQRDVGGYLEPHLTENWGRVGKLEVGHYTFYPNRIKLGSKHVELTNQRAIRIWCYLAGCLNHNLIENSAGFMNLTDRPKYQAMNHMDREFFRLSTRVDEKA